MSDLFQRLTGQVTDQPTAIQPLRVSRFTLLSDGALPLPNGLTQPVQPPSLAKGNNQWTGPTLPAPLIGEEVAQSATGALPSWRQLGRMAVGDGAPSAQPVRLTDAELAHEKEFADSDADLSVAEQPTSRGVDPDLPPAQPVGRLDPPLAPATQEERMTGSPASDAHLPYPLQTAPVQHELVASAPSTSLAPSARQATDATLLPTAAPISKLPFDPINPASGDAPPVVSDAATNITPTRAELSLDKPAVPEPTAASLLQEPAEEAPLSTKRPPAHQVVEGGSSAHTVHPLAPDPIQDAHAAAPALLGERQSNVTPLAEPMATAVPVQEPEDSVQVQPATITTSKITTSKVTPAVALPDLGETGANAAPVAQQTPVGATVQRKVTTQPDAAPLTLGAPPIEIQPMALGGQPQVDASTATFEGFAQTPPSLIPSGADELGVGERATPSNPQPQRSLVNRTASPEQEAEALLETRPLVQPVLSAPTAVTPSARETLRGETLRSQSQNVSAALPQTSQAEVGSVTPLPEANVTPPSQPRITEKISGSEPLMSQSMGQLSGVDSSESNSLGSEQIQRKPTAAQTTGNVTSLVNTPAHSAVAATPNAALVTTAAADQAVAPTQPFSKPPSEATVAPLLAPEHTLTERSQYVASISPMETETEAVKSSSSQAALAAPPTQVMQDLALNLRAGQPDPAQVVGRTSSAEISANTERRLTTTLRAEQAQVEPRLQPATITGRNLFEQPDGREKGVDASTVTTALADETAKTPQAQPQPFLSPANASAIHAPQTENAELAMQTPTLGQSSQTQASLEATLLPSVLPHTPPDNKSASVETKAGAVKSELPEQFVKNRPIVAPANTSAPGIPTENSPRVLVPPARRDEPVSISAPGGQPTFALAESNPVTAATTPIEGTVHPAGQVWQAPVQNETTPATSTLGATQPLPSTPNQSVPPPDSTVAPLLLTPTRNERMGTSATQVEKPAETPIREVVASSASSPRQKQPAGEVAALTRQFQPAQSNQPMTPELRNGAGQQPAQAIAPPAVEEFALVQPVHSRQGARQLVDRQLGVEPVASPGDAAVRTADTASVRPHFENFTPKRKPTTPPEPQSLPTIHVTIGRLIVQTAPEMPKATAQRRTTQPPLSLDAYLQQRTREVL